MTPLAVKICGLTREPDALAACAAGADLLGFVFVRPSPRFVEPALVRGIVRNLPPQVATVGVFAGEDPARVQEVAATCGLSFIQLHGPDDFPLPGGTAAFSLPVIRVLRVGGPGDLAGAEALPPGLLLLDSRVPAGGAALGGTGRSFDWSLARGVCAKRPVIVAGGLDPGNVGEAVASLAPWGVDVSSGVESSPGVKDPRKVERFISAAREAAKRERRLRP